MSVAALTIDETHTNVIKSELIQNNGNLLHKIKSPQTVNLTTSSNYFGGHDGIDTDAVLNNKLQHPSLHLSTTSAVILPKHEIFSINTSTNTSSIEKHCRLLEEENQSLKVDQTRLQQQCSDAQRRERILMRRLANKEQEFQDYVSQIAEYKLAQAPGAVALRSALLDPAVNLLFEKLKKELQATKAKLEETQNELSAWKFTPDSNTGKRLMAKCRLLYQENEELGKMTSNGRLAKLETELAMQKSFSEEVKKSQSELDDFLQELDEDVEGMQSTILFLQQQLKGTKEHIHNLEKENYQLKNGIVVEDDKPVAEHLVTNGSSLQQEKHLAIPIVHLPTIKENDDEFEINNETINEKLSSNHNSYVISTNSNIVENNMNINKINVNSEFYSCVIENSCIGEKSANKTTTDADSESNNDDKLNVRRANLGKRNYDSDSTDSTSSIIRCPSGGINKKIKKKNRRSSVLSNDLDDDNNQKSISNRVIIGSNQLLNIDDEGNSIGNNQRILTRRKSVRNLQNGAGEAN